MKNIIVDYSNHFAPLRNAAWFKSLSDDERSEALNPDPEVSEMAAASVDYAAAFSTC